MNRKLRVLPVMLRLIVTGSAVFLLYYYFIQSGVGEYLYDDYFSNSTFVNRLEKLSEDVFHADQQFFYPSGASVALIPLALSDQDLTGDDGNGNGNGNDTPDQVDSFPLGARSYLLSYPADESLRSAGGDLLLKERLEYMYNNDLLLKDIMVSRDTASLLTPFLPPQSLLSRVTYAGIETIEPRALVVKSVYTETASYFTLRDSEYYDKIFFKGFEILQDADKFFTLKDKYFPIYDQYAVPYQFRKNLEENDIDSIKMKIDKLNNDFSLEVARLRSRVLEQNSAAAKRIVTYLLHSTLPAELQSQIQVVFATDENRKDFDEYLRELVALLEQSTDADRYTRDIEYLKKQYRRMIKLDRTQFSRVVKGNEVNLSLYDIVYSEKENYYDRLKLINEYYLPSRTLALLAAFYHVPFHRITVSMGHFVKLHDAVIYDNSGKLYKKIGDLVLPLDSGGRVRLGCNREELIRGVVYYNNFNEYLSDPHGIPVVLIHYTPPVDLLSAFSSEIAGAAGVFQKVVTGDLVVFASPWFSLSFLSLFLAFLQIYLQKRGVFTGFLFIFFYIIVYCGCALLIFAGVTVVLHGVEAALAAFLCLSLAALYKAFFAGE